MALPTNCVFEVRSTGSDSNSGGFVTGSSGTDFSVQNSSQYNASDLTVDSVTNTKVTSVAHVFVSTDVGNLLRVTGGAGWTTGWYQIVSVAGGAATLDRSPATVTTSGGIYVVGGALATPGLASSAMVGGNVMWVKAATYPITSASPNVANGTVALPASTSTSNISKIIGYNAARGDNGPKPVLQASGISTFALVATAASGGHVENIAVNGNNLTNSQGISLQTSSRAVRCKASSCTNSGILGVSASLAWLCEVTGCSTQPAYSGIGMCIACTAHDNTVTGFSFNNNGMALLCAATNNTGVSSDGFGVTAADFTLENCIAYGNGRDGFRFPTSAGSLTTLFNCYAENQLAGTGFNSTVVNDGVQMYKCGAFNNSTNVATNIPTGNNVNFITLSASAFTSPGNGDYSLNSQGSGGSLLKAAGYPDTSATYSLPGFSTNNYLDVGVSQSQGSSVNTPGFILGLLTKP